jgi:hypothetical protein
MPKSIRVAVFLFALAALHGIGQVVYAWSSIFRSPHHQPLLYYAWIPIYTIACLPMILAALLAGLTLFKVRFPRLTIITSGVAALIFPFGTIASVVTLAVARQHFPWWYRRHLREQFE